MHWERKTETKYIAFDKKNRRELIASDETSQVNQIKSKGTLLRHEQGEPLRSRGLPIEVIQE